MAFRNIEFPRRISMGALREASWKTTVARSQGGQVDVSEDYIDALHAYDISFAIRTYSDWLAVQAHHHMARGRAYTFPFRDPIEHRVEQSQGVLVDDGVSPAGDYQMVRRYGSGGFQWDRRITLPESGTIAVYRTRSGTTTVATADATISYTTGLVVMANHVGGDTYAWSGQFFVPCRYGTDTLPALLVDRKQNAGERLIQSDQIRVEEDRT